MIVSKRRKTLGMSLIISLLFLSMLLGINTIHARAAEVDEGDGILRPDEYIFNIKNAKVKSGEEYEMLDIQEVIQILVPDEWKSDATEVTWYSSDENVIVLEPVPHQIYNQKMIRKGPGFATITANLKLGAYSYTMILHVKVGLEWDYGKIRQNLGVDNELLEDDQETTLVLYKLDQDLEPAGEQQLYLRYVDGGDTSPLVLWTSENNNIATVDSNGKVVAKGAGTTYIKATTKTFSKNGSPQEVKIKVVVRPAFSLSYYDTDAMPHNVYSVDKVDKLGEPAIVPSEFTINSNARRANNLKWEIYDLSTGKLISPNDTSKMSYNISELSGSIMFTNVKAGTYEIFAYADNTYNKSSDVPYAYLKIVVPVIINNRNLNMTVGDIYNILDNSNIPDAKVFKYSPKTGTSSIVSIDKNRGIFTANKYGEETIFLTYENSSNLYDVSTRNKLGLNESIEINIKVIDGIALSKTEASIYTTGSLQLYARLTDETKPVQWTSSNESIATVEDGLVKALKPGIVTITATQTIDGIVKKATCEITVLQAIEKVVVEPSQVIIPINGTKTLIANVSPKDHTSSAITWESSDENIVSIVSINGPSVVIQGKAGGNAVISAINTDNVVVGYCHVTVEQPVKSISLSESSMTVDLSVGRIQLNAIVYPENAYNKKVHWSSSDTSKARVDDNGLVTLIKPGTVTIYATSDNDLNVKAMCEINIEVGVSGISITEKEKTMFVDQTAVLTYNLLPLTSSNTLVTWSSTNDRVASVDASGKVTAKSPGTAVIIVRSNDGGYTDYCTITVSQEATGVSLDVNTLELMVGDTYIFETTIIPQNSTKTRLLWETSDSNVVTVDHKGKVTAKASGIATVTVRTEAGAEAICKITVKQPVTGVILNFSEKTIYVNQTFRLRASVTPSDASNLKVTWSTSDPEVAAVTEDGIVEGKRGGSATITVTTEDGGIKATCVVKVIELANSIKLNYETYNLGLKESLNLEAEILPATTSNKNVTWTSSDKSVARVDKSGKVTGVALGYATITATTKDGSNIQASCVIRVVRPVTSIKLDTSYFTMIVGTNRVLKPTIKPSNATYRNVKWVSSDEDVAVIEEDGTITALKAGKATITAYANDNSGKKAVAYLTVKDEIPSTALTLSDKKIVMSRGEERTLKAVLRPADSTDGVTWSSSNSSVVEVNTKTGKIKAKSTGTATITAMTESGKSATVEINVVGLNINSITLEQYEQFMLQVEGNTSRVTWTSNKPSVAQVRNGMVTTKAVGEATITAKVDGKTLTCKIKVTKIK